MPGAPAESTATGRFGDYTYDATSTNSEGESAEDGSVTIKARQVNGVDQSHEYRSTFGRDGGQRNRLRRSGTGEVLC